MAQLRGKFDAVRRADAAILGCDVMTQLVQRYDAEHCDAPAVTGTSLRHRLDLDVYDAFPSASSPAIAPH